MKEYQCGMTAYQVYSMYMRHRLTVRDVYINIITSDRTVNTMTITRNRAVRTFGILDLDLDLDMDYDLKEDVIFPRV